jgi:hypothetical protein
MQELSLLPKTTTLEDQLAERVIQELHSPGEKQGTVSGDARAFFTAQQDYQNVGGSVSGEARVIQESCTVQERNRDQ